TAGSPASLNITGNQVSLDGWVNINSTNDAVFFGKSESFDNDYCLFMLFGQLAGCIKTSDSTEHFIYTGYVPPLGQWTHIALTYDGSTEIIYVNGVAVGRASFSGNIASDGLNFSIGARDSGLNLNGSVDEVEVFNRGVSAIEVQRIYLAGSLGKCRSCVTPPSGMLDWWPGDGNTKDIQGGNTGQLKNGASFGTGEVAQAFRFDSSKNQYVDVGSVDLPTTFTIDAWINPSNLSSVHEIISNADPNPGGHGYELYLFFDGLEARVFSDAGVTD